MLVLGMLLALSLVTILTVLFSCEVQARATRATGTVSTVVGADDAEFERIVAPLLADPDFGRIDRRR